jgi:hypothetical protein
MSSANLSAYEKAAATGYVTRVRSRRGGGGNFGVVTSFHLQMRPLTRALMAGDLIYSFDQARDVLRFLAEYVFEAPDEMWVDPVLETEANGHRQLLVNLCHCGDLKSAEREVNRLRDFKRPLHDTVGPKSYVKLQSEHDMRSPSPWIDLNRH